MENGPHEEAEFADEETREEVLDLPSTHCPDEDYEEDAGDEDKARQPKRARHSKGESASASLPTKQVSNPEVDDMGLSSPSAFQQL